MKFKLKKYVYLVNDLTNLILKQEKDQTREELIKAKRLLKILTILFILSALANVYFLFAIF